MMRTITAVVSGHIVAPLQMWITWPISQGLEVESGRVIDVDHTGHDILIHVKDTNGSKRITVRFPLSELVDTVFDFEDYIREVQEVDEKLMKDLLAEGKSPITHQLFEEERAKRNL